MDTNKKRCNDCHIDHLPEDYHQGDKPGRTRRAKAEKHGQRQILERILYWRNLAKEQGRKTVTFRVDLQLFADIEAALQD